MNRDVKVVHPLDGSMGDRGLLTPLFHSVCQMWCLLLESSCQDPGLCRRSVLHAKEPWICPCPLTGSAPVPSLRSPVGNSSHFSGAFQNGSVICCVSVQHAQSAGEASTRYPASGATFDPDRRCGASRGKQAQMPSWKSRVACETLSSQGTGREHMCGCPAGQGDA